MEIPDNTDHRSLRSPEEFQPFPHPGLPAEFCKRGFIHNIALYRVAGECHREISSGKKGDAERADEVLVHADVAEGVIISWPLAIPSETGDPPDIARDCGRCRYGDDALLPQQLAFERLTLPTDGFIMKRDDDDPVLLEPKVGVLQK